MKLYKYMERRWAEEFIRTGKIQIGTLYGFRKQEELGDEIGDRQEGLKDVYDDEAKIIDTANPDSVPYFLRDRIRVSGENRLIMIGKGGVGARVDDPDCYIYCLSQKYEPDSMTRMGYDCCIEVSNSEAFIEALTSKLLGKAQFVVAAPCVYRERRIHFREDSFPGALIKEPQYKHQYEFRTIWFPIGYEPIKNMVVRSKVAASYCRILA